jgi:hypothetical protein
MTVTDDVAAEARSPAVIAAVSVEPPTKVVARLEPFHWTVEPLTKPAPNTLSTKPGPWTMAASGETAEMEGAGLLAMKVAVLDGPPPGPGLKTVTDDSAAEAMSLAAMKAVRLEPLTKVVARLEPFHCTVELLTKLAPNTLKAKPDPPTVTELGERAATAGAGLSTAKLTPLDSPPPGPGLNTATDEIAAEARSPAVMTAARAELLT